MVTPVPTEWSMIIQAGPTFFIPSYPYMFDEDQYVDCDLLVRVSNERIDEGNAKVRKNNE